MKKQVNHNADSFAHDRTMTVTFKGLTFVADVLNGTLEIEVPVKEYPEMRFCFLSDEARDWVQSQGISEYHYSAAYEAAKAAFTDSLTESSFFDYMKEHQVK